MNSVYSGMDNFISSIMKQRDDLILKTFEYFGYTKEWLFKNRDKVLVTKSPSCDNCFCVETFSVCGIDLFRVWNENTYFEGKITTAIRVEYLLKNMKE